VNGIASIRDQRKLEFCSHGRCVSLKCHQKLGASPECLYETDPSCYIATLGFKPTFNFFHPNFWAAPTILPQCSFTLCPHSLFLERRIILNYSWVHHQLQELWNTLHISRSRFSYILYPRC
jgi:hypothetical protein